MTTPTAMLLRALAEEGEQFFRRCFDITWRLNMERQITLWVCPRVEGRPGDRDLLHNIAFDIGWEGETFMTLRYPIGRPMPEDAFALISHGGGTDTFGPYSEGATTLQIIVMLRRHIRELLQQGQEQRERLQAIVERLA